MISQLTIRGLGPHEHTVLTFSPKGTTTIRGRSEVGKSTVMDAISLVLWGEDRNGDPMSAQQLRDGHDAIHVEAVLASGTVLVRRLSFAEGGGRKHARSITKRDGVESRPATEKAWLAEIGRLGADDRAVVRLAMMPGQWQRLAAGAGGGRPLRDALLEATKGAAVDIDSVLAELFPQIRQGDPTTAPAAEARRKDARRSADAARGRADEAESVLLRARAQTVVHPGADEVAAAKLTLASADDWRAYDRASARQVAASSAAERYKREHEAWAEQKARLGDRPDAPAGVDPRAEASVIMTKLSAAQGDLEQHRSAAKRVEADREVLLRQAESARREVAALESGDGGHFCPTCGRGGWDEGARDFAAVLAKAMDRVKAAEAAVEAATERLSIMGESADALTLAVDAAAHELDRVRVAVDAYVLQVERVNAWDAAWQRLRASEPMAPSAQSVDIMPPSSKRPTDDEVTEARARVDQETSAVALHLRYEHEASVAAVASETAKKAADDLEAEVARLELLVAATRQAPSVALESQLAALGDISPVTIVAQGDGGGVEVLVDGRPWYLASDGRTVVADAALRAGIRRALRLPWLMLIVDRVQDVAGQPLPVLTGPVVLLETTDCDLECEAA